MSKPTMLGDLNVSELIIDLTENPPDEDFRQMVIYELMKRCNEEIDQAEYEKWADRMRDQYEKKVLPFPKRGLPWPMYID